MKVIIYVKCLFNVTKTTQFKQKLNNRGIHSKCYYKNFIKTDHLRVQWKDFYTKKTGVRNFYTIDKYFKVTLL